jgi:molybdate transport system permease protein
MTGMTWNEWIAPVLLSLKVSFVSSIVVFGLGGYAALRMRHRHFRGKTLLETVFMLPLVLPPTVVGFLLLIIFGRDGWVGRFIEFLSGQPIVFSWIAAVIAAVIVAFPLVYQTVKVGLQSVDRELEDAGRSIGASERQVLRWITVPLAARGLAVAYVLGFTRALGEFGATLMLAGNIPGRTQTVPTAIFIAVESGNLTLVWAWCGVVIFISTGMLWVVNRFGYNDSIKS